MSAYLQDLGRDFRYASRSLSRTPGFTAAAVLIVVAPTDLVTFGCVVLVIIVAAVLAAMLSSRDAGRTDPSHLLRCE